MRVTKFDKKGDEPHQRNEEDNMCDSSRESSRMLCLQSDIATQKEKQFIYTNIIKSTHCIKRGVSKGRFFQRTGRIRNGTGHGTADKRSAFKALGRILSYFLAALSLVLLQLLNMFVHVTSHMPLGHVPGSRCKDWGLVVSNRILKCQE